MAAVVQVTDAATKPSGGGAIEDDARIVDISRRLNNLLRGQSGVRAAEGAASLTHKERRLHQMMFEDRNYCAAARPDPRTEVSVTHCAERGYTVVMVRCRDRPKLLFDTVCTIADMGYVVHHGTVSTEHGDGAYQEYYIRHVDGRPLLGLSRRFRKPLFGGSLRRSVSEKHHLPHLTAPLRPDPENDGVQWAHGRAGEDGFNGLEAPDFLVANLYRFLLRELRGIFYQDAVDTDSSRRLGGRGAEAEHGAAGDELELAVVRCGLLWLRVA